MLKVLGLRLGHFYPDRGGSRSGRRTVWNRFLESSRLGRVRSRVVAEPFETLILQVATGIIRSRATTPTDNPALLDSTKGSKFRGEPPSSSSVNIRAGRRPSTHAAVEPSTNRPNRNGLVEA
ncbi:hypothetical protein pipiens_019127 [Culex pipiens pipiens]|uniref:Uncharacterized protein n=1 Tax=Culex pipiens pipiens TaxID=38569 RepID=A0ABD1DW38_CULPP